MENFTMVDFNYFDVTIGAIVIILGIKGFMNGFIKEAFGLLGLVAGVYFASRLSAKAGTYINENFIHIDNLVLIKLIGFLLVLVLIWLSITVLGSIFSKLTSASGLGFINRLFGFIVGGGKYFLIFALIITALSNIKLVQDNLGKHVSDSILYPYLKRVGSSLINLDPKSIGLNSNSTKEVLKDVVNQKQTEQATKENI